MVDPNNNYRLDYDKLVKIVQVKIYHYKRLGEIFYELGLEMHYLTSTNQVLKYREGTIKKNSYCNILSIEEDDYLSEI
jgi:hypothetical protein